MARYIDAEQAIHLIENDALLQVYYSKSDAIDCINATPAADVVKVVRCKDCKHLMKDIVTEETPYGFDEDRYVFGCRKFFESSGEWVDVMLDDYCSSGERRKGDG